MLKLEVPHHNFIFPTEGLGIQPCQASIRLIASVHFLLGVSSRDLTLETWHPSTKWKCDSDFAKINTGVIKRYSFGRNQMLSNLVLLRWSNCTLQLVNPSTWLEYRRITHAPILSENSCRRVIKSQRDLTCISHFMKALTMRRYALNKQIEGQHRLFLLTSTCCRLDISYQWKTPASATSNACMDK